MIRTRFAPSPTGLLHVGGVRTALFAWLVAKQAKGQFILRIEDTDKAREDAGSEAHIMECLRWLGLDWDEGPDVGGKFEPYRQSQRLDIYKQWAKKLLDEGRAYADPYSTEELDKLRAQAKAQKKPFLYRDYRPDYPPQWDSSQPLRFKSQPGSRSWDDAVMGELSAGPEAIDDFIILKSDGYPTYNFAHIIDDNEMQISHVIRSQEFLPSVPRYLDLYEALGLEQPILATLPYVMGPDGKKKLSKRDGAKDLLDYRQEGYLPDALFNFLGTLGWNDGTEQELFTRDELVEKFNLERVQKSGARFDERRLLWMNGHYIRHLPGDELSQKAGDFWGAETGGADSEFLKRILEVSADRLKKLSDLPRLTAFFFKPAKSYEKIAKEISELFRVHKGTGNVPKPAEWLRSVAGSIKNARLDNPESFEKSLKELIGKTSGQPQALFGSLRLALTGADQTPPVWQVCYALGKNESLHRLEQAIAKLET